MPCNHGPIDNNYELLHDRIDIRAVKPITEKEYFVGGTTALLDAMGRTINKIINVQKNTDEDYRAERQCLLSLLMAMKMPAVSIR